MNVEASQLRPVGNFFECWLHWRPHQLIRGVQNMGNRDKRKESKGKKPAPKDKKPAPGN